MRLKSNPNTLAGWLAAGCFLLAFTVASAQAADFKFEAFLVWATHAEKSPDPQHKAVSPEVRAKLKDLPLKWEHFFEVSRKSFSVSKGATEQVPLSPKCSVRVSAVDGDRIEVSLIGKGEPVLKRTQALPKGDMLVLGGNAPDASAWLVVLKRIE
jgi:hypothetical protein